MRGRYCPTNTYHALCNRSFSVSACHANTSNVAGSRSQRACVCDPGLFGVFVGARNAKTGQTRRNPAGLVSGIAAPAVVAPSLATGPRQPHDPSLAIMSVHALDSLYECTRAPVVPSRRLLTPPPALRALSARLLRSSAPRPKPSANLWY
jgi:hypothetical protein